MGFHSSTYKELKKNVGSKITKNKTMHVKRKHNKTKKGVLEWSRRNLSFIFPKIKC